MYDLSANETDMIMGCLVESLHIILFQSRGGVELGGGQPHQKKKKNYKMVLKH